MMTVRQAFECAVQHHQAGRLVEAEALYRQIVAVAPNHADAWHYLGLIAHRGGRSDLALEWIRRAIALVPNDAVAHSNLGVVLAEQGKLDEAIAFYRRAIELKPDYAESHNNLGNALNMRGQPTEAVAEYRRALEIKPDYPEVHNNLGNVFREAGQLDEAVAAYRRAVQFNAEFAKAYNNLAGTLVEQGRIADAIAACHRALEIQPDYPEAYNNLGNALRETGELDEAMAAYRHAIQLKPDCAEACNNLGVALNERGQPEEAVAACHRALEIRPEYPQACNSLGNALNNLGRFDEAMVAYRRATQLDGNYAAAYSNLGVALAKEGKLDEAVAAYRRALTINPEGAHAQSNLGNALKDQGKIDEAIAAFQRAHELVPKDAGVHSNLVFSLYLHPSMSQAAILAEHERWNRQYGEPAKRSIRPHANDRNPERRLRIGYVSPDLFDHVVGRNLVPLFQCHEEREFDIICYSSVIKPDSLTETFRRRAGLWRDITGVSDQAVADMIRADGVDILVDLSQHSAGNRLPLFAHWPAPVQVSFAGYPATAGVEAIRYRISDKYLECGMRNGSPVHQPPLVPSAASAECEMEQVFLIDSFWCYDPCGMDVPVSEVPAQAKGWVTFGSLNNFCKINDEVLKLWARVLRESKEARLILLSPAGSHRQRVTELFTKEGIDVGRVEFVGTRARQAYLELYRGLDIALDPFPYNGHTTSLDALWMGVPVVSLARESSVSRAGMSQLSNLGLRELVAFSENDYVEIATRLAHDLPRLAELRRTLRARMEASVLMDAKRFAQNIETAYRAMWRRWCAEKAGE